MGCVNSHTIDSTSKAISNKNTLIHRLIFKIKEGSVDDIRELAMQKQGAPLFDWSSI